MIGMESNQLSVISTGTSARGLNGSHTLAYADRTRVTHTHAHAVRFVPHVHSTVHNGAYSIKSNSCWLLCFRSQTHRNGCPLNARHHRAKKKSEQKWRPTPNNFAPLVRRWAKGTRVSAHTYHAHFICINKLSSTFSAETNI